MKNWASATRNPGASSSSRPQSPTKAWPRYSNQSPTAILHQVRTIQPQSPVDPATAFQPVPTAIFLQSVLQISVAKLLQSMLQLLAVKLLQSVLPATKLLQNPAKISNNPSLQNPTEISNNPSRLRTAQPRLVRPSFSNLARPSYCPTLPDCPAIQGPTLFFIHRTGVHSLAAIFQPHEIQPHQPWAPANHFLSQPGLLRSHILGHRSQRPSRNSTFQYLAAYSQNLETFRPQQSVARVG
ncbi:hypothetical protein GBA52_020394 [Prunus armeniaca]|nr:hypothetical protein GBA52_020394 [Prunus armeniaca]